MGNGSGRTWPLVLIAASAAAAIWSGWVGLGELCGFGVIHPLPGIAPGFQINAAITLPVSVEAYGAYALGAWMRPETPQRARKFARRSAFGALAYGAAGQVAYHLLAAAGATAAPWPVVVVVSCMPVAVLGLAAALTHLLRAADARGRGDVNSIPRVPPAAVPVTVPAVPPLPSVREVRTGHACGPATEKKIRRALRARDTQWAQAVERSRGGESRVPRIPAPAAFERGRGGPVLTNTAPAAAPAGERPPSPAGASPNGRAHG